MFTLVYWPQYTNGNEGLRYSDLDDITKENVKNLKVAWKYSGAFDSDRRYAHQSTPVFIDDGSGLGNEINYFHLSLLSIIYNI